LIRSLLSHYIMEKSKYIVKMKPMATIDYYEIYMHILYIFNVFMEITYLVFLCIYILYMCIYIINIKIGISDIVIIIISFFLPHPPTNLSDITIGLLSKYFIKKKIFSNYCYLISSSFFFFFFRFECKSNPFLSSWL
jgi:hypothetical protein